MVVQKYPDFSTTKYIIKAKIEVDGVVEKPDVVGAVFGQTEGLLGEELDLRELQKTGRIGRIRVNIESVGGKSDGTIVIPSSLDRVDTAILAAALETVDRVGPCTAKVTLTKIEDVREEKRKKITDRATELLRSWEDEISPESSTITEDVTKKARMASIVKYGEEELPAGPGAYETESLIIVEGRADVVNLLRHGFKNVIAVEGTNIPQSIVQLSTKKTATAFVDGDRGGELILKELLQVADIDYVARAPQNREVEDLSRKEIIKMLRNRVPVEQLFEGTKLVIEKTYEIEKDKKIEVKTIEEPKQPVDEDLMLIPQNMYEFVEEITETSEALILSKDLELLNRVPVGELTNIIQDGPEIYAVIFDGIITQRLIDLATEKGAAYLIGAKMGSVVKKPVGLVIATFEELGVY